MSNPVDRRFAIIGAGNVGRILLDRLTASGVPAENLAVCDSDSGRATAVAGKFGVRQASLSDEAIYSAEVILIAPPPKSVPEVLWSLAGRLTPGQLVISFAAIVPLERLEAMLPDGIAVVRIMPNAPSMIGQGMNPVAYGTFVSSEHRSLVAALLNSLGESLEVDDEQMNWCVGLTGAAMRSLLPVLEGMAQAGVEAGIEPDDARRMAARVMLGTAALVLQTGRSFEELKALTPMDMVDEAALSALFLEAARAVKEKMDRAQNKLWQTELGRTS